MKTTTQNHILTLSKLVIFATIIWYLSTLRLTPTIFVTASVSLILFTQVIFTLIFPNKKLPSNTQTPQHNPARISDFHEQPLREHQDFFAQRQRTPYSETEQDQETEQTQELDNNLTFMAQINRINKTALSGSNIDSHSSRNSQPTNLDLTVRQPQEQQNRLLLSHVTSNPEAWRSNPPTANEQPARIHEIARPQEETNSLFGPNQVRHNMARTREDMNREFSRHEERTRNSIARTREDMENHMNAFRQDMDNNMARTRENMARTREEMDNNMNAFRQDMDNNMNAFRQDMDNSRTTTLSQAQQQWAQFRQNIINNRERHSQIRRDARDNQSRIQHTNRRINDDIIQDMHRLMHDRFSEFDINFREPIQSTSPDTNTTRDFSTTTNTASNTNLNRTNIDPTPTDQSDDSNTIRLMRFMFNNDSNGVIGSVSPSQIRSNRGGIIGTVSSSQIHSNRSGVLGTVTLSEREVFPNRSGVLGTVSSSQIHSNRSGVLGSVTLSEREVFPNRSGVVGSVRTFTEPVGPNTQNPNFHPIFGVRYDDTHSTTYERPDETIHTTIRTSTHRETEEGIRQRPEENVTTRQNITPEVSCKSTLEELDNNHPEVYNAIEGDGNLDLCCPITQALIEIPVVASDGKTYEKHAIALWMSQGNATSPLTREPITNELTPDANYLSKLQATIQEKLTQQGANPQI
ncbi:MAG: U-box domain-containing protein [Pseudomonadota bacterium]|nr:U-box domain-containing protein [Pseudomonadota bacterium]